MKFLYVFFLFTPGLTTFFWANNCSTKLILAVESFNKIFQLCLKNETSKIMLIKQIIIINNISMHLFMFKIYTEAMINEYGILKRLTKNTLHALFKSSSLYQAGSEN